MSVFQEYRLAQSLVWSDQEFSLANFVKRYELPQVVLVVVGYCGDTERTTFGRSQVLTLHTLRTTSKIVCQVPNSNAVVVPTSCPLKAEVIPMDCRDTKVTAYQLSTTYQKIKYVRVMEVGSTCNNNSLDTLKMNDILQIKKIDSKSSVIRCKNLTTAQDVSILFYSTAVFVPLLDSNTYNLAEIQKQFGLPPKVRFSDKTAEIQMRSVPGKPSTSSTYLSDLGQTTAIEEIQESDVIVTTVCSNMEEKLCLNVPTTLDITITVAEGFLKGDETYQRVVKTLDKQFNRTNLEAFDNLDVYEHMDAVKKRMEEMVFIEEASMEVVQRAREHLQRVECEKPEKLSSFERPPNTPPSEQENAKQKAPPERLSKAGQKPESKQNKTDKKTKNIKLKFPYRTVGCKQSGNKTPSNESLSSGHKDEKPTDRPEEVHDCIDDIHEETASQNSHSEDNNCTKLGATYTPVPQLHEKYITEAPKAKETTSLSSTSQTIKPPPPLPIKPPPQTQEDKQEISRLPQNLSGTPPERLSKAGQKPESKQNKTDKKTKNIKLKFPYSPVGCKQSGNNTPSNETLSSEHKDGKPTDRPEEDHDCIDDIYGETASQNSHSEDNNYTELDTTYTPVPRLYEKYITEAPKAKETTSLPSTSQTIKPPPPLPIKPPPQTLEDKQAISRFPQNLSG
ncbi:Hypothetical predicted protein, partial [Paramuricea clavata]